MALSELLNPIMENNMYDDGDEEEIYQAVLDWREAEETRDEDDDDESDVDVKPSCCEALLAASILQSYVSDLDDPFARKLEGILGSFGRQTRLDEFTSLKPTTISDYFARGSS
ncbi:hypothetical protein H0H87_010614 [Tephrocybe sp. NHM501043]|nr:hypothetical protein H0H87_010614 [Tephrocybe sp. NHM501043]